MDIEAHDLGENVPVKNVKEHPFMSIVWKSIEALCERHVGQSTPFPVAGGDRILNFPSVDCTTLQDVRCCHVEFLRLDHFGDATLGMQRPAGGREGRQQLRLMDHFASGRVCTSTHLQVE